MRIGTLIKTFLDHPGAMVAALRSGRFSLTSYTMTRTLHRAGVRPGLIIDVGANAGQFATAAAHCWPEAHIVSFEPLPDAYARLQSALKGNPRVDNRGLALGSASGKASLRVNSHSHSSSLLPLGKLHKELFPEAREAGHVEVEVSTLDAQFPQPPQFPCLLKLDVQGFEYAVLEGGRTLLQHVDWVVAETSIRPMYDGEATFTDIITLLKTHDLELASAVGTLESRESGEIVQLDLLFSRTQLKVA